MLGGQAEWVCWQTGMELHYAHTTLFRMKEVLPVHALGQTQAPTPPHGSTHSSTSNSSSPTSSHLNYDYKSMRFLVRQEGVWSDVEVRKDPLFTQVPFCINTCIASCMMLVIW